MEGSTSRDHVVGIPVNSRAYGIVEPDFPVSRAYGIEEPEFSTEEATPDHGSFVGSFQANHGEGLAPCSAVLCSSDCSSNTWRGRACVDQVISPLTDANRATADRPTSSHGRKGDKIVQGIKEHGN
jgi:hypothetical protein